MKKEIKGRKKTKNTNTKNKPNTKNIKKRIPERKNTINNKYENKKIKKRIKTKDTKQDKQFKRISLTLLLIAIVLVYIILGIELALVAAIGSLIIIGLGLLLRKSNANPKKRKILNFFIILFLTLGILGVAAFVGFILYIIPELGIPVQSFLCAGKRQERPLLFCSLWGKMEKSFQPSKGESL